MTDWDLRRFRRDRLRLLSQGFSSDRYVKFMERWNPGLFPGSEQVQEAAFHKARTGATDVAMQLRKESKEWLGHRGLTSFDDGDIET